MLFDVVVGFFLIVIICCLINRFVKNPAGSLLNPLFYLLLFSSLYLLLPLLYIDFILEVADWDVSKETISKCYFWSLWYVGIFFVAYVSSRDGEYYFSSNKPSVSVVNMSKIVYVILTLLIIYIVCAYAPTIYSLRSDRGLALQIYESSVNGKFKLRILTYCHLMSMLVLFWRYRSYLYLLPIIGYLLIDYSHGGRTVSLMVILFAYIIMVLNTRKTYINLALCAVVAFIISGVLQRSASSNFIWTLYMSAAEFSNTYLTSIFLLGHPDFSYDGLAYMAVSLSKVLPGGFVDRLLEFGEWYGNFLSNDIGHAYGLAGNLLTEALVYGGKFFALINPLLIASICYILNAMRCKRVLSGCIFVLMLCISMQNIVRSYFWGFLLYPVQFLLFYLFWLIPDYRKKIFL